MIEQSFKTRFEAFTSTTLYLLQAPDGASGEYSVYRVASREHNTDLNGNIMSRTIAFEVSMTNGDPEELFGKVWNIIEEFHKTIDIWSEYINYIKSSSVNDDFYPDENLYQSILRIEINY